MDVTLRALNRFGLGARIGERERVGEPRGWLRDQLSAPHRGPEATASTEEISAVLTELRAAQQSRDQGRLAAVRARLREVQTGETGAMLAERVRSETPFVERLVAFWSNHLCVSVAAKPQVALLAGDYERTVIRPHVLGRFSDMVLASVRHPAMLFYLDNFQSVGPNSLAGRRTGRGGNPRGLNENHARELLELHTLGVNGGYEQQDVEQLARILTGWSISGVGPGSEARGRAGMRAGSRGNEALGFVFREFVHEPGAKTVMGVRYSEGGVREGERAIRDLCEHGSTARFVAEKLVRHFVADDPPVRAIEQVEEAFRESGGDLRVVASQLIDLDEAWDPDLKKFRTPQDWLVAVFRALPVRDLPPLAGPLLRQLRHTPWAPGAPKGYGDTKEEWADPDSIMNRAELARSLTRRGDRGARGGGAAGRLDPLRFLEVVDVGPEDPLPGLLGDTSIPAAERLGLAIGGPAFQWR